ncbi:hypothetical protein CVD25_05190 [Bacillus canaveralius]|uniref:LysM domain-containing protein n=1 Tax=Bacillus canaveralius TaxID=1403243 RepID=A0A2N5GRQ0_9BACI|nr:MULTISPECIES: LysM peptidoglycan-binding domain-containing protein [Bacillus]PLR84595.1 hypothetical protein CVD23_11855 [Bacillus sp. V33-4]PLR86109.1 hypothetical protein CU635_03480 [Bacillus canaveralius]PLS00229.1 hypothetical protein CVD25_05190 [Bacillus canaveralius]RSK52007.1 LysM peptidoglycan-binding domain-containing protein [Bacillus canaveralius]
MNRENPYRDQAERLRKKINHPDREEYNTSTGLPPRNEIHRDRQKKNNWKLKYPIIRLLALFFILLPICIFSVYSYLNDKPGGTDTSEKGSGYDMIDIDRSQDASTKKEPASNLDDHVAEENPNQQPLIIPSAEATVATGGNKDGETAPEESTKPAPVAEAKAASPAEDNQSESSAAVTQKEDEAAVIYHTVAPGETMYRIAMKYYQSQAGIDKIKQANNIKNNEIQVGQKLKIPIEQ